ncbi:MAG: hypothetical protein DRP89_03965 [Candidatus Neomarinimicrobiota bacterium]|nr:MAG: hypothetical protein DRP89_03965 [Candidatus Neomarinimicrobiota bacterium]
MIIIFIHLNSFHNQMTQSFENYRWNSYQTLLDSGLTKLPLKTVFDIFEGIDRFTENHICKNKLCGDSEICLE